MVLFRDAHEIRIQARGRSHFNKIGPEMRRSGFQLPKSVDTRYVRNIFVLITNHKIHNSKSITVQELQQLHGYTLA
jgi:hypothetical protein